MVRDIVDATMKASDEEAHYLQATVILYNPTNSFILEMTKLKLMSSTNNFYFVAISNCNFNYKDPL